MRGEQLWLEGLAREVRRRAGLEDDDNEFASRIAARVLGPTGIVADPNLSGPAYLRRTEDGGYQIVVRPTAPDVRFVIMHELAHFALRVIGQAHLDPLNEEQAANYIAAAILAPSGPLRRVHTHYGDDPRDLRAIAKAFGISQTSAHLRLAEVVGDERAIVTAKHDNVLARGSTWATVKVVEVARGALRRPDIVKATLRGGIDDRRVALRVK